MGEAPRIRINAPLKERAAYLQKTYSDIVDDPARLEALLGLLVPLQGRERIENWQALSASGERVTLAAELMRHHYDPRYTKRSVKAAVTISAARLDQDGLAKVADRIVTVMKKMGRAD